MSDTAIKRTWCGPAARIPLLAAAVSVIVLAAFTASASAAEVIYRAAPSGTVAAAPSLGFGESETAELGSPVLFAGSSRTDPTVGLDVSVWACEAGSWDEGCATTTPGAGFVVPLTLSVYAAGVGTEPGPLLIRQTKGFDLAYRPSAGCETEAGGAGNLDGFLAADGSCAGGLPQHVAWTLPGVTLPAQAIVTVAFDPDATPAAEELKVSTATPDLGADPRATEGVYRASTTSGALAFRAGTEWATRQPAFTIEAEPAPIEPPSNPPVTTAPPAATTTPAIRLPRGESLALRRKMTVVFPGKTIRIGGPGALVQARCEGAAAARCIGTLSLSVGGKTHKVPFSISKGRKQYVVVPLGDEIERISNLRFPRAVVTARTVQSSGRVVKTQRTLKLQ
jgi:hypothetical protein